MIRHVYEKARAFFDTCYVATDDERIERAVAGFGGRAIMTSTDHRSGTDRCREALDKAEALCGGRFDIVVNIQGDEPVINPEMIQEVISIFFEDETVTFGSLKKEIAAGISRQRELRKRTYYSTFSIRFICHFNNLLSIIFAVSHTDIRCSGSYLDKTVFHSFFLLFALSENFF